MKYAIATILATGGVCAAVAFAAPLNDKKPTVIIDAPAEVCEGDVAEITAAALNNGSGYVDCGRIMIQRNVDGVWNCVAEACSAHGDLAYSFDTTGYAGECIEFRAHFTPGGGKDCDGCKGAFAAENSEPILICVAKCEVNEGCSQGFWKNHQAEWANTAYATTEKIGDVFDGDLGGISGDVTLLAALDLGPQSGVDQARRNLLRQAVAAILNATHDVVAFPMNIDDVLALINSALDSGDADAIEAAKDELEELNELGCPL